MALSEPLERLQSDAGRFCIGATCCYPVPAAFHGESPILSSPLLASPAHSSCGVLCVEAALLLDAATALLEASSAADLQEMVGWPPGPFACRRCDDMP